MTFLLKKTVSLFLLPLPFSLILIAIGALLLFCSRAKRTRIVCFVAGFACLIFFSIQINAIYLINGLQSQYQPLLQPPHNVSNIVVLGGGISGGKNYPRNITLNSASLSRLVEGIRLFHLLQKQGGHPILILSGGRVFQSAATEAGIMRNTAVMLGIPAASIRIENGSRDTHEEALYLKKLLVGESFLLVTSAYHMPRSMALFQNQGMHPIAAPTQFFRQSKLILKYLIPTASGLLMSDIAIHEYLGILWAKLNHQIRL